MKLIRITTVPVSLKVLLKGQLQYMKHFFHVIGVSSSGKFLNEVEGEQEVEVRAVEMERKPSPFKDLISIYHLYKLFRFEKPHIVHTHTPKAGMCGMIAAWLANVPIRLHTVAGMPLMESVGLKRKLFLFIEWITYYCSTKVLPNSKGLESFILKEKLISKNKLDVIGYGSSNGIDTSYFSCDQISTDSLRELENQYGIKDADFILLFVGRLVGDKGINELVSAFKEIPINRSNIKLLLVGPRENDLDPLNKETINEIAKNDNIIEAGWQTDVRPFMAISDLFVFPSYREGFPNVVMQAGAMGLASIVTNINGSNEIIIDGENGLIIPSKNINALIEAIELLISDEIKRKYFADNARDMIQKRYEQQFVWDELLKMYSEELDQKGIKQTL